MKKLFLYFLGTKHRTHVHLFFSILILLLISTADKAWAGGQEVGDLGTVALGRGTAFVARADNLSSFYYNPAGLSKSKGPNLLIGTNIYHQEVDFHRSGSGRHIRLTDGKLDYSRPCTSTDLALSNCVFDPAMDYSNGISEPQEFQSVSLEEQFSPSPLLIFGWGGIGPWEDLALAVGLLTPPGFSTPVYPEQGAQRYIIREGNLTAVLPGIGISYAFSRYFQIGGVFLSGIGVFEQNQAIRLTLQPQHVHYNENSDGDADFSFQIEDLFVPTGILGVLSHPQEWFEIGISVKLPVHYRTEGSLTYTAPSKDMPDSLMVPGKDSVYMSQLYPWMLRTGVRYIHRYFDIEVDYVWENWSAFRAEYEIDAEVDQDGEFREDENGNKVARGVSYDFVASGEFVKNYQDSHSVRIGSDVEVLPKTLVARLGAFYTSSAYPDNYDTFTIDVPYGDEFGVSCGVTWHALEFLSVHAGYMHIFQLDVKVTEGIIQQLGPTTEDAPTEVDGVTEDRDLGNVVNNGSYSVSLNMFGLSFEGHI